MLLGFLLSYILVFVVFNLFSKWKEFRRPKIWLNLTYDCLFSFIFRATSNLRGNACLGNILLPTHVVRLQEIWRTFRNSRFSLPDMHGRGNCSGNASPDALKLWGLRGLVRWLSFSGKTQTLNLQSDFHLRTKALDPWYHKNLKH